MTRTHSFLPIGKGYCNLKAALDAVDDSDFGVVEISFEGDAGAARHLTVKAARGARVEAIHRKREEPTRPERIKGYINLGSVYITKEDAANEHEDWPVLEIEAYVTNEKWHLNFKEATNVYSIGVVAPDAENTSYSIILCDGQHEPFRYTCVQTAIDNGKSEYGDDFYGLMVWKTKEDNSFISKRMYSLADLEKEIENGNH